MERYDDMLFELGRAPVEESGYVLVNVDDTVEHGRRVFRFTIDGPSGVGVDDCAAVSREIEDLLDAELSIADSYVLEVSSPGLDHELKKLREYDHFVGRRARLVLRAPEAGSVLVGTIAGTEGETVRVAPDDGGEERAIPLSSIAKARLAL